VGCALDALNEAATEPTTRDFPSPSIWTGQSVNLQTLAYEAGLRRRKGQQARDGGSHYQ
jgi:hypothetical protein